MTLPTNLPHRPVQARADPVIKRRTTATCTPGDLSGTRQVGGDKQHQDAGRRTQRWGTAAVARRRKDNSRLSKIYKTSGRVTQEQGDVSAPTRSKQRYGVDGLSPFRLASARVNDRGPRRILAATCKACTLKVNLRRTSGADART